MKRLFAICLVPFTAVSLLALSGTMQAQEEAETTETPAAAPAADSNIERGRYLVENAVVCGQCHSARNASGEVLKSRHLHGAPVPVSKPLGWSEPWAFKAPRIAGLPQHTDEEFVRLMTTGVNRDDRTLMLPMPPFRMTEEDALAIAAYLRSVP